MLPITYCVKINLSTFLIYMMGRKRHCHRKDELSAETVKELNEATTHIDSLPEEMLVRIFSFLKQNELCQIARVCRRWDRVTRVPALWKKVDVICRMYYRDRFKAAKSITEKLSCYATYIKLDFRNRHNWKSPLDFVEFSEMLHKRCPHLQTLILRHAHLSGTLQNAVDLCTQFLQNIKVLVFHYSIFANCPTEEKYDCISKIEVLDVCGCVLGDFNRPPFSRMPSLKKLYLAHSGANSSWFQDPSFLKQLEVLDLSRTEFFSHTFQIIKDHGLQLKELYMCSSYLHDRHLNFNNSVFPSLETISLKFNYCVTCEGVISLIQSCPSLCQVFVSVIVAESFAVHPFVVANKCKFENVQVISSGYKKKSYMCA